MEELLGDEAPMMDEETIVDGTASLEEEMDRQAVYNKHAAALTALGEKLATAAALEAAEEESDDADSEEDLQDDEQESGGGKMEGVGHASSGEESVAGPHCSG